MSVEVKLLPAADRPARYVVSRINRYQEPEVVAVCEDEASMLKALFAVLRERGTVIIEPLEKR